MNLLCAVLSLVVVLSGVGLPWLPAQAADMGKLAFVRGGNVWIAWSNGGSQHQLTFSRQDRAPTVSPDGRWVAFHSGMGEDSGFGQLFMVHSQGGRLEQFRHPDLEGGEYPAFSQDGGSLVFAGLSNLRVKKEKDAEQAYATMSVVIGDLKTGDLKKVVSSPGVALDTGYVYAHPALSPDGQVVAYQESGSDVSGGIVGVNLKGRRVFRFPKDPRDPTPVWRPSFSPDGRQLLCYSPATNERQSDVIYLIDLDKGAKKKLALGSSPTFVDQGRAIVYEKWPPDRWEPKGPVKCDLWRLELKPGARPRLLIKDAEQPSGQM
jgi:TolB protein